MSEGSLTPKKVHPDNEDLESLSKADLISRVKEQEQYIRQLESKRSKMDRGDEDQELGERLKQQQKEATRRENTLVHRLTTKEQELQDFMNQIAEVKQAQTQGSAQLRSMLLDPAVNIVFQKMAKEMEEAQEKLKQTQNELSAWKFTPDSQTGKRLMARCQMLLQENEELGKTIASGRTAKLEGEIALHKTLVTEMKNNQSDLDEFLGDLEEDVEGMQTMIYVLQQQLRESKEQIAALEEENAALRTGDSPGTVKTFQAKQRDKHDRTKPIKTEETNHKNFTNSYGEEPSQTDYTPMETGFYQGNEKTDSDLEAEYNYEGLYENEDKYQEELEEQGNVDDSNYNYEENGYKSYEESYVPQEEYKETESKNSKVVPEEEEMDTDDYHNKKSTAHCETENVTNHSQAHLPSSSFTEMAVSSSNKKDQSMSEISSRQSVSESEKQHPDSICTDTELVQQRVDGIKDSPEPAVSSESKDLNHVSSTQKDKSHPYRISSASEIVGSSGKEDSAYVERTTSPKPMKTSPTKNNAPKAVTPDRETRSKADYSNGSPNSTSGTVTSGVSPVKLGQVDSKAASPGDNCAKIPNEHSPVIRDPSKSPSAGSGFKDREPVLQKFLNGVTSTVDDIEDL